MNIIVEGRLVNPDFGVQWGQIEISHGRDASASASWGFRRT